MSWSNAIKQFLAFASFLLLSNCGFAHADPAKAFRVEGHVFSATTLRPLPGAQVELWAFFTPGQLPDAGYMHHTDEGGFFSFEITPTILDAEGNDPAIGYAFAFICRHGVDEEGRVLNEKVQVQSLYSSLKRDQVYHRNVYMQVPENVTACRGLQYK